MFQVCFATIILTGTILSLIYFFLIWNVNYWRKRGVQVAKSLPLIGSFPSAFTQKRNMIYDMDDIYRKFKIEESFVGVFMMRSPKLLILSPELVHTILVTDFKNFHDNEFSKSVDEKSDFILANNPFTLTGDKWKERRLEIVPGMTPNRIKAAYPISLVVCQRLIEYIKEQSELCTLDGIDSAELCLRYTSEVVSECVLGIKADSLSHRPSPIYANTKKLFDQTSAFAIYKLITGFFPIVENFYKMRFFPRDVESFFIDLMQKSIDLRRSQNIDRIDFLNYMLQLQDKRNLSTPEVTSHIMTYLTDGFLTTATVISHCLLLLARHQEKQNHLREEISENLDKNGYLSFESLSELPYLDACLHETLRIFSPVLFSTKICTSPYEIVNKNGIILKLEKNDVVMIPVYSLHHDETIYTEPEAFKPERFLPENGGVRSYRDRGVFLGFGDGPRVCLGMRFGLTQSKAAVVEIVKHFLVKPSPKTRSDNTLQKDNFFGSLEGGIWLHFELINSKKYITRKFYS